MSSIAADSNPNTANKRATSEYSGTIYHLEQPDTLIINQETFRLSPVLMSNVTSHFQVGDRVKIAYRPHDYLVKCVVMERSGKG